MATIRTCCQTCLKENDCIKKKKSCLAQGYRSTSGTISNWRARLVLFSHLASTHGCTWSFKFYSWCWIHLNYSSFFLTNLITGLLLLTVNSNEYPSCHCERWVSISSAHVLSIPEQFQASLMAWPRRTCRHFSRRCWRRIAACAWPWALLFLMNRDSQLSHVHTCVDVCLLFCCHENCTRGRDVTPTQSCSSWRLEPSAAHRTNTLSLYSYKVLTEWKYKVVLMW